MSYASGTEAPSAISLCLELADGNWVEVAAASCRGPRRANEDNFLVILPDSSAWRVLDEHLVSALAPCWPSDRRWLRVAIMDGMGGHANGREVAEKAAEGLLAITPQNTPEGLRAVVQTLHRSLLNQMGGVGKGGCTLIVADIDIDRRTVTLLNVGDSRAWLVRHCGRHYQVTLDHRTTEFSYRDGDLETCEYRQSTGLRSNRLAQALGFGSFLALSRDEQNINAELRIDLPADLPVGRSAHADVVKLAIENGDAPQ